MEAGTEGLETGILMLMKTNHTDVRFQLLMATSMMITVFWDDVLYSLVEIDICSGRLMMEAVSTSEIWVSFYHTTWCNIPEDSHLQTVLMFLHSLSAFLCSCTIQTLDCVSYERRMFLAACEATNVMRLSHHCHWQIGALIMQFS
jgi:hypothetical protein